MFDYFIVKLATALAHFSPGYQSLFPDSYTSEDTELKALRLVLKQGYRWIRTDGDYAVFEYEWPKPLPMDASKDGSEDLIAFRERLRAL